MEAVAEVRLERGPMNIRLLFQAPALVSDDTIRNFPDNYLLSITPERNNIVHVAVEKGHWKLIKEALRRFPALIDEKNESEDTPLHVGASRGDPNTVSLLISHLQENNSMAITQTANNNTADTIRVREEEDADSNRIMMATNLHGDTPLHVAVQSNNIDVAAAFCRLCTQQQLESLFYTRNDDIRTPLHLLALCCPANGFTDDWKNITTIYKYIFICADSLRVACDREGNTPLHLAIKSGNFSAAKLLMQRCLDSEQRQELNIKNNSGHSAFDLLTSQVHMMDEVKELKEMAMRGKRLEKERAEVEKMMDNNIYKAAVAMDCNIFDSVIMRRQNGDIENGSAMNLNANFLAQTLDGSNIIHIALKQGKSEGKTFIVKALNRYPSLLVQADSNGDTTLHLAAKLTNIVSEKLLECFVDVYERAQDQHRLGVLVRPWAAKNSSGNMPVHEALRTNNFFAARVLTEKDAQVGSYINDFGETPLHVHARFSAVPVDEKDFVFETLINKNSCALYVRDKDGLTPLLRAAKSGRIRIVQAILEHKPQSAYMRDYKGRTFLHLLRFTGGDIDEHSPDQLFKCLGKELFKIPEVDAQRLVQDFDDNTPLHYAMKTGNLITAEILAWRCLQTEHQSELKLVNNQDETVISLLASHDIPIEIVELIRKKHPSLWYSARNSYGVGEAHIKDSAASLSVIAALLITITFTAAFQVPGGFDGDGIPILLHKAAFQVFLVSDAIAMCSSTIVLFSLLWVMGSGKKFDSFILVDVSFFLLQASFYTTLVAFMTGVFVVTARKTLSLAIFVCALCSLVILITWKTSILFLTKHIRLVIDMLLTAKALSFRTYVNRHMSPSTIN